MKKILTVLLLVAVCVANAAAYDYVVDSCSVDITVSKDAIHQIQEDYTIDFAGPHHGIVRYIPLQYSEVGVDARILNFQCSDEYSMSYEDGFSVIRIGSADRMVQGKKNYRLSYIYDLGDDLNEGFDQFYFNIVGSGWDVPFRTVDFTVTVPGNSSDAQGIWVTSGDYGSTNQVQANVKQYDGYYVVSGTAHDIYPGQAVTIRIQFPEGWYNNPRNLGVYTPWDYSTTGTIVALILCLVCAVLSYLIWNFKGRDKVPVVTARYNPPDGFTPLETGYVSDGTVDDKDVTSMLYYWADKGYMCINEPKEGQFTFTKIFDLPKDAPDYEKDLFNGLFHGMDDLKTVKLDDFKDGSFYHHIQNAKLGIASRFSKEHALKEKRGGLQFLCMLLSLLCLVGTDLGMNLSELSLSNAIGAAPFSLVFTAVLGLIFSITMNKWYVRKSNTFMIILSVVVVLVSAFFHAVVASLAGKSLLYGLVAVAANTVCLFFAVITSKRTPYGDKILEEILGYREFIQKVSMDEIKMMIDKDPQYYYHVLSYAIVLGLEDVWASKFRSLTIEPPTWYGGAYWVPFGYGRMSSRLSRAVMTNAIPAQVKSSSRVGGISFGSSGFSGGGFGGGGGHAW